MLNRKIILMFSIVILSIISYGYFAVKIDSNNEFEVCIDLSKPTSIIWPCEISIVGDNGEKGLRIGPNIGRGWREEAGGEASYHFFIPEDGKYCIWAYCLWYDECANAIFAKIDDLDRAIIGNDPVYNKWHWVRGFDIKLEKGTHSLVLSNHSDHISLQKILLSTSSSVGPMETDMIFSDIFYDGFDGCDMGNFTTWQQISGDWSVMNPESQTCLIENSLIGKSNDQAFIIYKNDQWENYSVNISAKLLESESEEQSIGICFGVKSLDDFYLLQIRPTKENPKASMAIIKKGSEGLSKIISEFECPFEINKSEQIQISLDLGKIEIKISDNDPVNIEMAEQISGGIGLLLEGETEAYFDDIHVRSIATVQAKQE